MKTDPTGGQTWWACEVRDKSYPRPHVGLQEAWYPESCCAVDANLKEVEKAKWL